MLLGSDVNYHVKISKDLSKYLTDPAYFDMTGWDSEEICLVRDYAHGFYYTPHPDLENKLLQKMESVNANFVTTKQLSDSKRFKYHTSISESDKRKKAWHSLPTEPRDVGKLLEIGVEQGLFLPGEFGYYFAEDMDVLYRATPKGKLSLLGLDAQFSALSSVLTVCESQSLSADITGMQVIAEGYPRATGELSQKSYRSALLAA
jgi:hypothetical protein